MGMFDGYEKRGEIFLPKGLDWHQELKAPESQPLRAETPLPLSLWQRTANALFYARDDSPVSHFGTLGSVDPLLPRALAADWSRTGTMPERVYELGPGAFHFAKTFMAAAGDHAPNEYIGCDFSDSSQVHVQSTLPSNIKFRRQHVAGFAEAVKDDPLHVVAVELLDDTETEFFARRAGQTYSLWVEVELSPDVEILSRSAAGRLSAQAGNFSMETSRLLGHMQIEERYQAADILKLIANPGCWEQLKDVHPSFLHWLRYPEHRFISLRLDEIYHRQWRGASPEFREYGDKVLAFLDAQIAQVPDGKVIHLPIAGVELLWKLHDRQSVRIDIFDYGYDCAAGNFAGFKVYHGQITAPVNFELLRHAAEELGFAVILEHDREFIQRILGEEAITIRRVCDNFKATSMADLKRQAFEAFYPAVMALSPDAHCTPENILSHRVRRSDYEACARREGWAEGNFSDGGFHLAVWKESS